MRKLALCLSQLSCRPVEEYLIIWQHLSSLVQIRPLDIVNWWYNGCVGWELKFLRENLRRVKVAVDCWWAHELIQCTRLKLRHWCGYWSLARWKRWVVDGNCSTMTIKKKEEEKEEEEKEEEKDEEGDNDDNYCYYLSTSREFRCWNLLLKMLNLIVRRRFWLVVTWSQNCYQVHASLTFTWSAYW